MVVKCWHVVKLRQIVKLMVHDSATASEELRSIAEPESCQAPRSTGQFQDVQVTFTSQATLSKTPGLLDIS